MYRRTLIGVFGTLAACSGGTDAPDISRASFIESFPTEFDDFRSLGVRYVNVAGDEVEVYAGLDADGAFADVLVDISSDLGGELAGNATYGARYSVEGFRNVVPSDSDPDEPFDGDAVRESGTFTASADLSTGRLTGADDRFTLNGIISEGALSGTVTFDGLEGPLQGKIGQDDFLGGFLLEAPDAALGGLVRSDPTP